MSELKYFTTNTDNKPKLVIPCEIWSRPCGYFRPVQHFNPGKKEEFIERAKILFKKDITIRNISPRSRNE
jgi:anaerobic ribonucleoside-triphosphate reductase